MKSLLGVLAITSALGVPAVVAGGASGAGAKSCQSGFTESRSATNLTVSGDTCGNARRVAERTVGIAPTGCVKVTSRKKGTITFKRPCVRYSYRCRATSFNNRRSLKVTCTSGSRQIRFRY
jgi:hypothetical protein